jgi:mannose/cellobiose epimerase-like protein (N-acyl-D-glucosamine 2-epimerase family)
MTSIHDIQSRAKQWLFDVAAPFWSTRGIHDDGMFVEAFSTEGEVIDDFRRLRVQARQIYSFCEIGRLGWSGPWRQIVERALLPFIEGGLNAQHLFINAFDGDGQPSDMRGDLYSQAFGLFALAHAGDALGRPDLFGLALTVLDAMEKDWSRPQGGYWEGDITPCPPYRQNPHMHMFEAALAHYRFTSHPRWKDLAVRISMLFKSRFQHECGAVTEYFDKNWRPLDTSEGKIVEPGHCLEWAWLFETAFDPIRDVDTAERLLGFARRFGISSRLGVTINEVSVGGEVVDGRARLWPQTERIKSAIARYKRTGDMVDCAEIVDAYCGLEKYFAPMLPGLWLDKLDEVGAPIPEPVPASSFYHIVCAMAELLRAQPDINSKGSFSFPS